MANSKSTYSGDDSTTDFGITFPYLDTDHIAVKKNNVQMDNPTHWTLLNGSTIRMTAAPVTGDTLVIQRVTSQETRLVDYQSGAVLTEEELDLDSKQAFYLLQETAENYSDLIDTAIFDLATSLGVIETDPDLVIDQLVQTMIDSSAASELAARITDIDANASSILSLTTQVQDWGADITVNASVIATVETDLGLVELDVTGLITDVGLAEGDIVALEARYGVSLNVNNYITGFAQHNDGVTGSFQVLADEFYIVDPANDGQNPTVPFAVVAGEVYLENVTIASAGQAGTGQRTEISSANNELYFYGDRGDASVTLQATIGINTYVADDVVGYFGSTDAGQSNVALLGLSNSNRAIFGVSTSHDAIYGVTSSTGANGRAGVQGVSGTGNPSYGVRGGSQSTGGAGVFGEGYADKATYGVHGTHRASAGSSKTGYGVYCEHEEDGGIPLFIKPDSADTVPLTTSISEGSIWMDAGGNRAYIYRNDDWADLGKPKPINFTTSGSTTEEFVAGGLVIPPECMKVTIFMYGVDTTGGSDLIIQLGYGASSWQATGYTGRLEDSAGVGADHSTGHLLETAGGAATVLTGKVELMRRPGTDVWIIVSVMSDVTSNFTFTSSSYVFNGGELNDIRITSVGGTQTFSSGQFVAYAERF